MLPKKEIDEKMSKWIVARYLEGYNKSELSEVLDIPRSRIMNVLLKEKIDDIPFSTKKYLPDLVYDENNLEVNKELRSLTLQRLEKIEKSKKEKAEKKKSPINRTVKEELPEIVHDSLYVEKYPDEEQVHKAVLNFQIQPRRMDIFMCQIRKTKENTSVQHGYRPVIILQNNVTNFTSTTVICVCGTSQMKKTMPMHTIIPRNDKLGLMQDTLFMCEQIVTVDKSDLREYVGSIINTTHEQELMRALKVSLGMLEDITIRYYVNEKDIKNAITEKIKRRIEAEKETETETETVELNEYSGAKGLLYVKCPKCGMPSTYFLQERANEVECKSCRATIPLDVTYRFEYSCDCLENGFMYGRTNMSTPFIKVCNNKGCTKKYDFKYDNALKSFVGKLHTKGGLK